MNKEKVLIIKANSRSQLFCQISLNSGIRAVDQMAHRSRRIRIIPSIKTKNRMHTNKKITSSCWRISPEILASRGRAPRWTAIIMAMAAGRIALAHSMAMAKTLAMEGRKGRQGRTITIIWLNSTVQDKIPIQIAISEKSKSLIKIMEEELLLITIIVTDLVYRTALLMGNKPANKRSL